MNSIVISLAPWSTFHGVFHAILPQAHNSHLNSPTKLQHGVVPIPPSKTQPTPTLMASTKPDIETVDDTDPRIVYSGSWRPGGVALEFSTTTHGTSLKDSQARFIFNGMSATLNHRAPPI